MRPVSLCSGASQESGGGEEGEAGKAGRGSGLAVGEWLICLSFEITKSAVFHPILLTLCLINTSKHIINR